MAAIVYLAGPEVFLSDGLEVIERKKELARRHGLEPAGLHGEFSAAPGALDGLSISRRNEALMDAADVCIANLTPFRGVSADPGTVYEVGYMIARGSVVFGYTADPRSYAERVAEAYGPLREDGGKLRMPDGQAVEDHGWSDNLMMEGGIAARGWEMVRGQRLPADPLRDLTAFEACLARVRESLAAR